MLLLVDVSENTFKKYILTFKKYLKVTLFKKER